MDNNTDCFYNHRSNQTDIDGETAMSACYLKKPDKEDNTTHGAHHAAVVEQKCLPAAAVPQVELLCLVVVAVVS